MLQAIGRRGNDGGAVIRPGRTQTMFEPSNSSSSLLSNGSSRSSQTDDLARTIDDLAEAAEQQLEEALRNQADVSDDIRRLIQLLRQVRFVPFRTACVLTDPLVL